MKRIAIYFGIFILLMITWNSKIYATEQMPLSENEIPENIEQMGTTTIQATARIIEVRRS